MVWHVRASYSVIAGNEHDFFCEKRFFQSMKNAIDFIRFHMKKYHQEDNTENYTIVEIDEKKCKNYEKIFNESSNICCQILKTTMPEDEIIPDSQDLDQDKPQC